MARFRYRAVLADGALASGYLDAADHARAVLGVRRSGARPIEIVAAVDRKAGGQVRANAAARKTVINLIGELAVLLKAGLPLDRSLTLAIANVDDRALSGELSNTLASVREGAPLSSAMRQRPDLFSPTAAAMAEAGEANGRLGPALARLAAMLEEAEDLRRLIATSMIYPIALLVIAVGVILLMLLFVVPQFESLFASTRGTLPTSSLVVMGASQGLRTYWLHILTALAVTALLLRQLLARPQARAVFDRLVLRVPQLGPLVRQVETARFSRTLGALLEGGVPLPNALALARRTIGNRTMANAVAKVADGVKQGGGLTDPLAATGVFPRVAIGFLRTGEETSQLGPMLERLADVLDRDVKVRLQRLVGILTPALTVALGASVAGIVASIMSAIIGFNDLAISQ